MAFRELTDGARWPSCWNAPLGGAVRLMQCGIGERTGQGNSTTTALHRLLTLGAGTLVDF